VSICTVNDCARPIRARGWCTKHWSRWRRKGDPLDDSPRGKRPIAASARFWPKVNKGETCWLWQGAVATGYGVFNAGSGKAVYAHRFAYEELVGPIPNGLTLDHLCRTPRCVNPEHLEPVTQAENSRRAAKVTQADVDAMRQRWSAGESQASIAASFGVNSGTVSRIVRGVTHAAVTAEDVA
jgi:hypothetical protein